MKILIKNAQVINPEEKKDGIADILIEDGKIAALGKDIKSGDCDIIDASGKIVMPGIIDMHVHLRQPGREDKETIFTGTQAALKGGVTSLLAMPNTIPAIDSVENIKQLKEIIKTDAKADVFIAAAISKGRQGREISDIARLKDEGAIAITDDGASVEDEEIMLEAMKKAAEKDVLVICHCEDKELSAGGCVNLGFTSTKMGLRGISNASEHTRVKRDIELAQKAGAKVHIAHVSCAESVQIISKAKKRGVMVSAETCPHYFALNEESVLNYDPNFKMNPPLRSKNDMLAIIQGLSDGTIDVISSDHAPHTENEKEIEFERAEFGVVGLETELSVTISELVNKKILSWQELAIKMSYNPARILGINKAKITVGSIADLVIISPEKDFLVEKKKLISKSKNSAFIGKRLKGLVEYTFCGGKIAYKAA